MKKTFFAALCLFTVLSLMCVCGAEALGGERLQLAFGLFSVLTDAEDTSVPNRGNWMGDLRYELDAFPRVVNANYAPLDSYEQTAQRRLDSYVSYLYAVVVGPNDYSETPVTEETLPNGIKLNWQLMRGSARHALWFEAFSGNMGYNVSVYGDATDEADEKMLSLMRSFEVNEEMELGLLNISQTKNEDGSFISVERGLRLTLTDEWNLITMEDMLYENTAFMLEKGDGRCMIQMLCELPLEEEELGNLFSWYAGIYGSSIDEAYTVTLDGLGGIQARVIDAQNGIFFKHFAFVYQNYGYYGSFMWIPDEDENMRDFMTEALMNIAPAEG